MNIMGTIDVTLIYNEKLRVKNEKLKYLYSYMEKKDFKVTEDEINNIENYLMKKERLCKELVDITKDLKLIKELGVNTEANNVQEIVNENDNVIRAILRIDEINKAKIEKIYELIKENIKAINSGRKLNQIYLGITNTVVSGYVDSVS